MFGMRLSFRSTNIEMKDHRYAFLTRQLLTPAIHRQFFSGSELTYMRLGCTLTSESTREDPVGTLTIAIPETEVPLNFDLDEIYGLLIVVTRDKADFDDPTGHLRVFATADP